MSGEDAAGVDRRTVLGAVAGLGAASLSGCSALDRGVDAETMPADDDRARELAERFAPTLYFDAHERWFPTDPRPYTSERDGETVVDGFDAFDGYHERFDGSADGEDGSPTPPNPTVFYRAVEYADSPLSVAQFWFYSAFDQFTTNFHWHDWEVLHVFVDDDSGDPQLFVASSHSRKVPNNEFLDPDPDAVPRILPELGSHSSTLSINDVPDRFQRLPDGDLLADVTNTAIEGIEDLAEVPLAYGLPRDEGWRLPYVVPEYEGAPLHEHDRLPSVTRESLVDEALTVRSLDALQSPPTDLPTRETGLVFRPAASEGDEGSDDTARSEADLDTDVAYDLVPTSEIEHIAAFTGPQLSFEFSVPEAVEDAVAGHITTTGVPWDQPRYENPAADITARNHRAELADRYEAVGEAGGLNAVVTRVTEAVTNEDAPDGEGLTTVAGSVESVVLLESDPEAVPTFGGVAAVQDVPAGEHRFTVNGAGRAPHSERVTVADEGDAPTVAGVDGEVPLVARENATKLTVGAGDGDGDDDAGSDEETATEETVTENTASGAGDTASLSAVAVEDDFAGRIYDSAAAGSDALYVHAGGAYTTEVRDADDAVGAYRVNPDPDSEDGVSIDRPETGKASLAAFLADIAEETRAEVAALVDEDGDEDDDDDDNGTGGTAGGSGNAVQGLARAFQAVVDAAEKATERAQSGDRGGTDRQLEVVAERLRRAGDRLAEASGDVPDPLSRAAKRRLEQADRRAAQARESEKL
ncbi:hypothetical protein [Haloparvum sedimenti]|uniref:hypothetical protein n=1 Tax=Haloparvum sedimenti TaxID=1678448 RepID=UPI00071E854C|nr:hypothetical protein [Haloparvum sedimenti]